MTVAARL